MVKDHGQSLGLTIAWRPGCPSFVALEAGHVVNRALAHVNQPKLAAGDFAPLRAA